VQVGTNFAGQTSLDSPWGPPDPIAAVGPNHVVEMVNENIAIYNKATGALISNQTTSSFWGTTHFPGDVQVMYDELAGRFVASAVDFMDDGGRVYFAVSNSSDPTQPWAEKHIIDLQNPTGVGPVWGDFDKLVGTADAYVIKFNTVAQPGSTGGGPAEVSIARSSALDTNPATLTAYQAAFPYWNALPAKKHNSVAGDPVCFIQAWTTNSVLMTKMTNLLSSTPTYTDYTVSVPAYTNATGALQPGGVISVGSGFSDGGTMRGNTRWAIALPIAAPATNVSYLRWYEFNVSGTPFLIQNGTIQPGTRKSAFNSSVEVNVNGDIGVTYMQSGPNQYPSMYVAGRKVTDGTGTMQAGKLVKSGSAALNGRYGDYAGIGIDPANGTTFWACNEYVPANSGWGTWIGSFAFSGALAAPTRMSPAGSNGGSDQTIHPSETQPPDPRIRRWQAWIEVELAKSKLSPNAR